MTEPTTKLEKDIINLARIALSGRTQDVMALLHRIAKANREKLPELAAALTELVREAPTRASPLRRQTEAVLPVDADTRFQLLRIEEHPALENEPVYEPQVREWLDRIVNERKRLGALIDAGLEPSRTVLFTGPPGVGKTLAARWLARELKRPLLTLDLAAVMSSYLGRTGTNLRHVLDYAKTLDCVLLLDELDAIAKRRDDRGEIGELKRLVTVLIQEIDDWPSSGLLVAATNHADLLDPAIWRRFDLNVQFPLPSREAIARHLFSLLESKSAKAESWSRIIAVANVGKSFGEIDRDLNTVRRQSVLSGTPIDENLHELVNSAVVSKADRIQLAADLVNEGLLTQRAAQSLTGVARETIRSRTVKKPAAKRGGADG